MSRLHLGSAVFMTMVVFAIIAYAIVATISVLAI
jgi:hypothetical protein